MLAARWPDNIRHTQRFDWPPWHYINHPLLPADYAQTVKPLGECRLTLAWYRLADVLRQLFEQGGFCPQRRTGPR